MKIQYVKRYFDYDGQKVIGYIGTHVSARFDSTIDSQESTRMSLCDYAITNLGIVIKSRTVLETVFDNLLE
jgi:hypothetical protein